jgi:hypothetical protein
MAYLNSLEYRPNTFFDNSTIRVVTEGVNKILNKTTNCIFNHLIRFSVRCGIAIYVRIPVATRKMKYM